MEPGPEDLPRWPEGWLWDTDHAWITRTGVCRLVPLRPAQPQVVVPTSLTLATLEGQGLKTD